MAVLPETLLPRRISRLARGIQPAWERELEPQERWTWASKRGCTSPQEGNWRENPQQVKAAGMVQHRDLPSTDWNERKKK